MPLTTFPRRVAVLVGTGALTIAALTVATPPASAAGLDGLALAGTTFSTSGGGGCTVTNTGSSTGAVPFTSGGAPFSANVQQTSVATDPGDLSDVTSMTAGVEATARAVEAAGVIAGLEIDAHLTATVSAAQGAATDCSSQAQSTLQSQGTFTLPAPMILDLRVSAIGTGLAQTQVMIQRLTGMVGQVFDINLGLSNRTRRIITLPAGDYVITAVGAAIALEPDAPSDPQLSDVRMRVRGTFSSPGSALGAQKGTGNKYLTLPAGLACSTHTVVADFTKKAGPKATGTRKPVISKATFYVNDARVKKVRRPHKKTNVTLRNLPDTDELVVEARLRLRGKGTVTVTRTYLPCT